MRHDIVREGYQYRIRPIELGDARVIVELRLGSDRNRFLHSISDSIADQERYLEGFFERPDEYYWAVERRDESRHVDAVCSLYNLEREANRIELGRLVVRPQTGAGTEAILLVAEVAFYVLDVDELEWYMAAENASVLELAGRARRPKQDAGTVDCDVDGRPVPMVRQSIRREVHLEARRHLHEAARARAQGPDRSLPAPITPEAPPSGRTPRPAPPRPR